MNLPFESSGGSHVQKNMFPAFWKLMVEIRASVRECASLFCDLDVLGCGLETPIQGLLPPSTKIIPGHGKEGDCHQAQTNKEQRVGNDLMKSCQAS